MPVTADTYYHLFEGSEEGQKPTVVLIHGAGGNHLYWPTEIRRLPGQRVLAIDLPGHGKSGGRGQQSIQAYACGLVEWLEAIGLHRAVFVGHSMGSAIALTLALDYPDQVLGLGLLGAGARLHVAPELLESTASQATILKAVEMVVSRSFSPQAPASLVELAARRMAEVRPSVLNGDFQACDNFDVMERLPQINVPCLIMCGADDQMTPTRYSQFLADKIPNSVLKIVPETGHMVMLEQPHAVAKALDEFLAGISY